MMNQKEAIDYAMHRGRVRNTKTGEVGNLVSWPKSNSCSVFTGYVWIGNYQAPQFAGWLKADTEKESNAVPVGGAK